MYKTVKVLKLSFLESSIKQIVVATMLQNFQVFDMYIPIQIYVQQAAYFHVLLCLPTQMLGQHIIIGHKHILTNPHHAWTHYHITYDSTAYAVKSATQNNPRLNKSSGLSNWQESYWIKDYRF
jgi:hypothetical protein